jgi:hypothetical protein
MRSLSIGLRLLANTINLIGDGLQSGLCVRDIPPTVELPISDKRHGQQKRGGDDSARDLR